MSVYQANDKYRATLRTTWIYDPADTTLAVTAIPTNVPTVVVVGWDTSYETVFSIESTSGTNISNYTLTGVTRLRGYAGNLPENLAVNCLNNEEFFNQWGTSIAALEDKLDGTDEVAIEDPHGNEVLKTAHVDSAVNEFTITNAATATNPVFSVTGDDTNVGMDFKMKGTGYFRKPTVLMAQVVAGTTDLSTGDGKAYFTIPAELNGMNLISCHARVITAGTTGTTDIQIANVTDTQDMLSTKLTIDSAETGSDTAATAYVINTSYDDVATNDLLRIDIDAVSTTAPKGLIIRLGFALP